ncbi:MAG: hypothetical protein ABSE72_12940 [Bacteroidales bacterium]
MKSVKSHFNYSPTPWVKKENADKLLLMTQGALPQEYLFWAKELGGEEINAREDPEVFTGEDDPEANEHIPQMLMELNNRSKALRGILIANGVAIDNLKDIEIIENIIREKSLRGVQGDVATGTSNLDEDGNIVFNWQVYQKQPRLSIIALGLALKLKRPQLSGEIALALERMLFAITVPDKIVWENERCFFMQISLPVISLSRHDSTSCHMGFFSILMYSEVEPSFSSMRDCTVITRLFY